MSDRTAPNPARAGLNIAQQGVAASHEQAPGSAGWVVSVVAVVRPALDADLLARAVEATFRELDGARVLVAHRDGRWEQWVDDTLARRLVVHDVREATDPSAAADEVVRALAATPLPLDGTTPLIQMHLVQVDDQESRWLALGHHVMSDGLSGDLVRRTVASWYEHLAHGAPRPERPAWSVADAWAVADAGRTPDTVTQWAQRLAGLPARVSLAERPGGTGAPAVRFVEQVPAELVQRLGAGSGYSSWTQPVLAVAAAYTARVTEESHVVLGFTVAGRTAKAERGSVTMLARVVPMVLDVAPEDSLKDLSRAARSGIVAGNRLGPITAEELLSAVPAAWRLGRVHGPIVNLIPFDTEIEIAGHTLRSTVLNRGPVEDLQLAVVPRDGGIELDLVASTAAYAPDEALGHVLRVRRLLELAAEHPETPLLDLDPSLPGEVAARDAAQARTGRRYVDAHGRPALVGAAAHVLDGDGEDTGTMAVVHPDGQVEDLGTTDDNHVVGGSPVHLVRVRRAAESVPGADVAAVRLAGRRVVVELTGADEDTRAAVAHAVDDVLAANVQRRVEATRARPVPVVGDVRLTG